MRSRTGESWDGGVSTCPSSSWLFAVLAPLRWSPRLSALGVFLTVTFVLSLEVTLQDRPVLLPPPPLPHPLWWLLFSFIALGNRRVRKKITFFNFDVSLSCVHNLASMLLLLTSPSHETLAAYSDSR